MTTIPPGEVYASRSRRLAAVEAAAGRRFDQVANLRLAAFLLAAAFGAAGAGLRQPAFALPAAALLVAFAVLVRYHGRLRRRRQEAALRRRLNDEGTARLARDWAGLPARHGPGAGADHPYAADLDLFGQASLMHLLDTTATPAGQARLRAWLLDPAVPETVRDRQAGAAELAARLEAREELRVRCGLAGDGWPDPEPFLAWVEGGPWLSTRRPLVWAARLSPALLWGLLGAWLLHVEPLPLWPLFLVTNVVLWLRLAGGGEATLNRVRQQGRAFQRYAEALDLLTQGAFDAALLARLQRDCTRDGQPAHREIDRLGRLADLAIPPSAQLYLVLQALFLWNVHVLGAVERWQSRSGSHARRWLEAVATFDALAALGTLAHDNPGWTYPELSAAGMPVEARALGHPLIPPRTRVDNDVAVGPPGTFLLVSGSNMAGKSTLLRALGVNVVLAQAGGPVCARALRLPPLELWTSMRVVDSLEQGVSRFLAELQRLRRIVEAARRRGPGLCYLLDEVLQGTNTAERQIAARRVIRHLVACGAIGAVTTHDLALAASPELEASARPVHFRETLTGDGGHPAMTFDYRLRPGPATSTNALRLMALVGLDLDEPPTL